MSNSEIKDLMARLRDSIRQVELDAESRALARELDADIHKLLDTESEQPEAATVIKRAKALEADFETKHPTAMRVLAEVIETLAKMGV